MLAVFMVGYISLGAIVFMFLEDNLEREWKDKIQQKYFDFRTANPCVNEHELEEFLLEVINVNNRGISVVGNATSLPNWSFGQSFFFAGTILTTVGYGRVTPLSEGGKVFCIMYALVGIPLTLIMFTALVERIMILTNMLLKYLLERMQHAYRTFTIRLLHLSIVVSLFLSIIFFLPAAVFVFTEKNWNYLDAFYYCFISMTTIGLGDYIPGENGSVQNRTIYKIVTTFYLFIGLVMMMTMLATIYEVPELNIGFHFYLRSDDELNEERVRLNTSKQPRYMTQTSTDIHQKEDTESTYCDQNSSKQNSIQSSITSLPR